MVGAEEGDVDGGDKLVYDNDLDHGDVGYGYC